MASFVFLSQIDLLFFRFFLCERDLNCVSFDFGLKRRSLGD